jgi:hypothetical protein
VALVIQNESRRYYDNFSENISTVAARNKGISGK